MEYHYFNMLVEEFNKLVIDDRIKFSAEDNIWNYIKITVDDKILAVIYPDYKAGEDCALLNLDVLPESLKNMSEEFYKIDTGIKLEFAFQDFIEDLSDMGTNVIKNVDTDAYHISLVNKILKSFLYEDDNENSTYFLRNKAYKSSEYKYEIFMAISISSEIYNGTIIECNDKFELFDGDNKIMEIKKMNDIYD